MAIDRDKDPEQTIRKRTVQQNRALHLYFTKVSEALNDAGLDMRRTLKADIEIPWNPETVKEYLFRPVMRAQVQKVSTTELNTNEIDMVFETLNRHFAERFGLHVPFPSIESIIREQQGKEVGMT